MTHVSSSCHPSYRGGDCARRGLGLMGTENTTFIIIMDIPYNFSSLDTDLQVQLCQIFLLELSSITMSKTPPNLPTHSAGPPR